MKAETFALPFIIGTLFLFVVCMVRFMYWLVGLSKLDKLRILRNLFTSKSLKSATEAFMEGLIHRKVFKQNAMLGYMHMSLAFGWFLLIVIGHLEAFSYHRAGHFPFHKAVFFRYYNTLGQPYFFEKGFTFIMDLLLLFVLSGVALAYYKRINKSLFGMKKTTRLQWRDYIALTALWFIFPLRLISEGITAGLNHNGGFITQTFGDILNLFLPLQQLEEPAWFAYSLSLGLFFVTLPASRYFHIPTEIFFIYLRNCGIKLKKHENTYARVQTFSCSRCGICLDSCQMNQAGIKNTQSVYVLKNIRNRTLTDQVLFNCLLCGRCEQACPVGIDLNDLRIVKRIEKTQQYNSTYDSLHSEGSSKADVIYFAGCMSHLTPSIIQSMRKIFEVSNTNFWFMDEQKAACCGRPLMQAGQRDAALKLIELNRKQIIESGAHTLVVSCPICYKVFKDDYQLPLIKILHHSEFILDLVQKQKIQIADLPYRLIYHDSCELGRGSKIYEPPRELLKRLGKLVPVPKEREKALCCGGSLSNLRISTEQRNTIRNHVIDEFAHMKPDYVVTACPLCKKTFAGANRLAVADIAELTVEAMKQAKKQSIGKKKALVM
jgi:Fe-S oxidoreductase